MQQRGCLRHLHVGKTWQVVDGTEVLCFRVVWLHTLCFVCSAAISTNNCALLCDLAVRSLALLFALMLMMILQALREERDAAEARIGQLAAAAAKDLGLILDKTIKLEWHKVCYDTTRRNAADMALSSVPLAEPMPYPYHPPHTRVQVATTRTRCLRITQKEEKAVRTKLHAK